MRLHTIAMLVMVAVCACVIAGGAAKTTTKPAASAGQAKSTAPAKAAAGVVSPKQAAAPGTAPAARSSANSKAAATSGQAVSTGPRTLVVLYTSSAKGQIRSCNCTKFRFGGYGRQLTLLKSIRESTQEVVLLEGGDISGGSGFQAKLKAGVAAQALGIMDYGAMVPGDVELGLGGTQMVEQFEKMKVPLVCANLYDKGAKEPKYKPFIVLTTRGGVRVGVIGALDKQLGADFLERSFGQSISDPVQAVTKLVPELRKKCDVLIVVYHGVSASAGKLAAIKDVDLVLCTHRHSRENLFPEKDSNIINVKVDKPTAGYVVDAATNENWNLGRLDLVLNQQNKIVSLSHKLIYLDRRYDEDPRMVKIYEKYSEAVTSAVLAESSKLRAQGEEMLAKRGVDVAAARTRLRKSPFAGDKACQDCHEDVHKSWAATRHSRAIESLKSTKQEFDPECISCHVTGLTTRNGYINYKETPELSSVQCEACHGPALEHTRSPEAGFGKSGEQTCRSCHTEDRDPDFEFDTYWKRIKH